MASGVFSTNVGPYWRLQMEWSSSANASANTSTVSVSLYWMAVRSGVGVVTASGADAVSITINGTSSPNATATPTLSAGQKKLIRSHSVVVPHNSNGTKSVSLSAFFDVKATLSGSYYGRVAVSGTAVLDSISRESTVSNTPNFTAGNNLTISVNRSSSAYRHEADIHVKDPSNNWSFIKTVSLSTSQTSVSSSFDPSEISTIFLRLDGRGSTDTRITLRTYNGSTLVGTTYREGVTTAPPASHPTSGYDQYWFTDETIVIPITRANPNFTHTVRIKVGSYTKTIPNVGDTVIWSITPAEENALGGQFPTSGNRNGTIEVDTFYSGRQVRSTAERFIDFYVRDANPSFSGSVSYADINSSITAITGNNQYIVAGKSSLRVTLPSTASAVGRKGATLVSYVASVSGETITKPYSTATQTFDFGTINASTNQTITVEVVDSRGNRSAVSKIVHVVPYSAPTITASALRINGFEASTILKMTSKYSAVNVNGVKNSITNRRYRTRPRNGSWGSYVTFPGTISTTTQTFTGTNQTVSLAITGTFDVEFSVSDRFGTTTIVRTVGVGRPIFFIDDVLGSIAMNDFPKDPNTFLLNGALTFAGNLYADTSEGGGAINLNNGDITKANAIFFNDSSNALLEGIHFAKSGITAGSVNPSDYDTFKIVDGKVTLQGEIINEPMNVAVLQNGWSHYSGLNGMYPPASYWKDKNGVVHITGMIGGGSLSSGLRLFSLPAGYRPAQKEIHYMYNPGTTHDHTRVDIFPEGYVQLVYSTNTNTNYIVLSNVSFRAAQ